MSDLVQSPLRNPLDNPRTIFAVGNPALSTEDRAKIEGTLRQVTSLALRDPELHKLLSTPNLHYLLGSARSDTDLTRIFPGMTRIPPNMFANGNEAVSTSGKIQDTGDPYLMIALHEDVTRSPARAIAQLTEVLYAEIFRQRQGPSGNQNDPDRVARSNAFVRTESRESLERLSATMRTSRAPEDQRIGWGLREILEKKK